MHTGGRKLLQVIDNDLAPFSFEHLLLWTAI